jgi:hypothetical protein
MNPSLDELRLHHVCPSTALALALLANRRGTDGVMNLLRQNKTSFR